MDKSLLMFRGGVRSATKKLADGAEHTLFYKARTPDEVAMFYGAVQRFSEDKQGDVARQKYFAEFIAASLCNEDGTPLMTEAEARQIPTTLKPEICALITNGSNEFGEAGKG